MRRTFVFGAAVAAIVALVPPMAGQGVSHPDSVRSAPDSARAVPDSARSAVDSARAAPDGLFGEPAERAVAPPDSVPAAPPAAPAEAPTPLFGAPTPFVAPDAPGVATSTYEVADDPVALLGITVSASGTSRDTLGLLISPVAPGSPADRGGIDAGNRLAEINNVSLRIAPANIGRRESEQGALHLLVRELQATQPGDYVRLRLFGEGRYRTLAIQTPRGDGASRAAPPPSDLQRIITGIGGVRAQLDRLMQVEQVPVPRDTLLQAERDLGSVERRLRAAQTAPRHLDNTVGSLPGLRVAEIVNELKDYFGEGSAGGLLVLDCDLSWDPLRNGDVIMKVNGEPANLELLRAALDPQRQTRLDFLRRGRYVMVTLHPRS